MPRKKSAFDRCVEDVAARGSAYDPYAVCAAAGVKKYGQREMTRRAVAGRRRSQPALVGAARSNVKGLHTWYLIWSGNGQRVATVVAKTAHSAVSKAPKAFSQREITAVRAVEPRDYSWTAAGGRSNPYESAAELSEAFHGTPAESVEYIDTPLHEHGTLTKLGRLVSIELKDDTELEFDADTMLSSNEAGSHLFIDGGDQSINLNLFPECDPTKEACVLGKAKYVTYETAKFHLGKRDKKVGPYRHKFGDETGDLPELVYDPVNRLLAFVGGHYYIDLDMPGGYSAGIRD